jgi:hypothetical protein
MDWSNKMEVIEINCITNKIIERPFTSEELAQYEADQAAAIKAEKDRVKKEAADKAAREAAIEHAKSLGFTDAMIAVMYPNLGAQ